MFRRLFLAGALSLAVPVSGIAGAIPAFIVRGESSWVVSAAGIGAGTLGLLVAAVYAPRVFPFSEGFPLMRRVAAGVAGIAAAVLAGQVMLHAGVDYGAASQDASPRALAEEGAFMAVFYGSMLVAGAIALGRPQGQRGPSNREARRRLPCALRG